MSSTVDNLSPDAERVVAAAFLYDFLERKTGSLMCGKVDCLTGMWLVS